MSCVRTFILQVRQPDAEGPPSIDVIPKLTRPQSLHHIIGKRPKKRWSVKKASIHHRPRLGSVVVEFENEKQIEPAVALSIGLGEKGILSQQVR